MKGHIKISKSFFVCNAAVLLLLVTACSQTLSNDQSADKTQSLLQTVRAFVTKAVGSAGGNTQPLIISATPVDTTDDSDMLSPTQKPSPVVVLSDQCYLAGAGIPLDLTIPDNTRLSPGESFSKTWRLVNQGSCTWDRTFELVKVSGDALGTSAALTLASQVSPGESVDITIDFIAPEKPGIYASYWMIKSPDGDLFGIGPLGDASIWLRIQVIAETMATAFPTATYTPLLNVLVSGQIEMIPEQKIDLDTGKVDPEENVDFRIGLGETGFYRLEPLNGALFAGYQGSFPSEQECRLLSVSEEFWDLDLMQPGDFICYQTNGNHLGVLELVQSPDQDPVIIFNFITWVIP